MRTFKKSEALERLPNQFFAKLVKKVAEVKKHHDDVINLGQGNPDQPTPQHIIEELKVAAENPLYHKYSPFDGFAFLKEAVANYYMREYGIEIDPSTEVAILNGTKTGLVEISQCFLNEGDTVLVPDPGYPDYWSGIALAGAKMKSIKLKEELDFHPDFQELSEKDWEEAKLMFLNYPNNPTGATATEELFQQVIELADEHDICVVHDFAYGAIGYDGQKPLSFLQIPGAKEVGIEMMTLSKTYNMAGWRVGFAIGNPSVIEAIELLQDHYYCSLFGGIQQAAAHALLSDQSSVEELVTMYESRRDVLVTKAKEMGWHVKAPKGSFFAWFKVPEGFTSEEFADLLLEKAHVVVAPGIGFGEAGEGYIRIGLLTDEDTLIEAMNRIAELNVFHTQNV
ncbi:diaminopimelate aminotransferase [Alkalihalobacillus alcalophilus ATCC 27647 = CGMCC 1.3604]|uniref:Aminotransferase n=1 Tax=Alkalihalobacillus alcalophilus ATCC 27647 = CGMCC 1.3604 TaxID=1218173 RepID=A0A094XB00_ALKAL|nr:pyridoxal phosphate-dependent aminotransferase [Alkalihalobacillus alcalophilus]KGA95965.1 aminotransferase [Alkalihalobacillus alcalophilus ATCC 27647 = CGMCC 1.3604]MED1561915.1 pyridoxal phosphate-dependent aminotransferase [Alkalihalobacillus alcalophilus]THG90951.1 diaminopimelate aminotransferase [Alkalihalobacillus alcalophilus ATCC 27647 = CGMCC 1.3604]